MKARLKSKGWGPFRSEWYSVCSAHYYHNESCDTCQCGYWHNVLKTKLSHFVYKHNPDLWCWWMNGRRWKRPPIFK